MRALFILLMTTITFSSVYSQEENSKKFRDDKKEITIELPVSWHLKVYDDGRNMKMFITKELLEKETDTYSAGVIIEKIRRYKRLAPDALLPEQFVAYYLQGLNTKYRTYLDFEEIRDGEYASGLFSGKIWEIKYRVTKNEKLQRALEVVVSDGNDVVHFHMVCAAEVWEKIYPIFEHALLSMKLR